MTPDASIQSVLASATERLTATSESARLDAEILLAQALDVPRSYLIAHPEDTLDKAALGRYEQSVDKRAQRVPIAYLTGQREFWSLTLMVSEATLVPRPETELIVDRALAQIGRRDRARVADLGTGSGAIALAVARERPQCDVVATDVSQAALEVARENARQNDIHNVSFEHGSWTEPLLGQRFDLVVTNPPYVRDTDPALQYLQHEPQLALTAGADGLDALRVIARDTPRIAAAGATLIVEHGAEQRDDVRALLEARGFRDIESHNDLAGHPRVAAATFPASATTPKP